MAGQKDNRRFRFVAAGVALARRLRLFVEGAPHVADGREGEGESSILPLWLSSVFRSFVSILIYLFIICIGIEYCCEKNGS